MASVTRTIISRILRDYISRHKNAVALASVCMIVAALATAANAYLLQPALDEIFVNKNADMLYYIPAAVIGVALIGGLATYGHVNLMRHVGQSIIARMQVELFEHLLRSDVGMFHDQSTGKLVSRFTNDIQLMRTGVSSALTGMVKELLSMVFLIGVMFIQSWELSLFSFIFFPLSVFPILRLGKRMRKITDGTQKKIGEFAGQLDETFSAVRMVKAYGREDYEVAKAEDTVQGLYRMYMKASRVQSAAGPLIELAGSIAIAGIILYGGNEAMEGRLTGGEFVSFVAALVMAYRPLRTMAGLNTQIQEGISAARRLFEALDAKPRVVEVENATPLELKGGEISFEQVSFHYDAEVPALQDVSLHVPAGKMVALVGPSGAGKSTIMNLLLRFYDVNAGFVTIDGQDISGLTFASLRGAMALVSQEVTLFDDTVYENIAYGRAGATWDEVEKAAKAADAHEFIARLPQGYDTRIGPSGLKLSGGQRQRLSIARAMLKNAPILLLDEATSSLDSASEQSVQKALTELMQHRTTLVIAHRLSTIRHADCIYVLDRGTVVESGTHEELLARSGIYRRLHDTQFKGDA